MHINTPVELVSGQGNYSTAIPINSLKLLGPTGKADLSCSHTAAEHTSNTEPASSSHGAVSLHICSVPYQSKSTLFDTNHISRLGSKLDPALRSHAANLSAKRQVRASYRIHISTQLPLPLCLGNAKMFPTVAPDLVSTRHPTHLVAVIAVFTAML
jgi:hypothetical protein